MLNEGKRFRHLDLGIFLTPDPLEYVDGFNPYIYVNQNPWGKWDPEGLEEEKQKSQKDSKKSKSENAGDKIRKNLEIKEKFIKEISPKDGEKAEKQRKDMAEVANAIASVADELTTLNPVIATGSAITGESPAGNKRKSLDRFLDGISVIPGITLSKGLKVVSKFEIIAKDGTKIKGFTKHGVDRVIGDTRKRAGVTPDDIMDTIKNPKKITRGENERGAFIRYQGAKARVVVNPETGKIISVNPSSKKGSK